MPRGYFNGDDDADDKNNDKWWERGRFRQNPLFCCFADKMSTAKMMRNKTPPGISSFQPRPAVHSLGLKYIEQFKYNLRNNSRTTFEEYPTYRFVVPSSIICPNKCRQISNFLPSQAPEKLSMFILRINIYAQIKVFEPLSHKSNLALVNR